MSVFNKGIIKAQDQADYYTAAEISKSLGITRAKVYSYSKISKVRTRRLKNQSRWVRETFLYNINDIHKAHGMFMAGYTTKQIKKAWSAK